MKNFFFFDLTTGICLVTFALSFLPDRSLMVCVKSLLLLLLVVLLHSVELLSLLFFSSFLKFWLSKSFLFGCLLSILVLFFNCAFLSGLFFLIFIFYHFLVFHRCSFSTSIYCCPCFNAILRFCGTHNINHTTQNPFNQIPIRSRSAWIYAVLFWCFVQSVRLPTNSALSCLTSSIEESIVLTIKVCFKKI